MRDGVANASLFLFPPQVDWARTAPDQPRRTWRLSVLVVGDFCLASRKCKEAMEKLSITNSRRCDSCGGKT